jgi:hypothetical protein
MHAMQGAGTAQARQAAYVILHAQSLLCFVHDIRPYA